MDDVIIVAKDERDKDSSRFGCKLQSSDQVEEMRTIETGDRISGPRTSRWNCPIKSCESKVKEVNGYTEPRNAKQLRRFLGFANYFRKFTNNLAIIAKPLYDLQRKDVEFIFGEAHKNAFELLKSKIVERPVWALYQPDVETELHTYASKYATAAILTQRNKEDNEFHPHDIFKYENNTSSREMV